MDPTVVKKMVSSRSSSKDKGINRGVRGLSKNVNRKKNARAMKCRPSSPKSVKEKPSTPAPKGIENSKLHESSRPRREKKRPNTTGQFRALFYGDKPQIFNAGSRNVETVRRNPNIFIIHDFLSSSEIEWIHTLICSQVKPQQGLILSYQSAIFPSPFMFTFGLLPVHCAEVVPEVVYGRRIIAAL
jgi:hypothetical protein